MTGHELMLLVFGAGGVVGAAFLLVHGFWDYWNSGR